MTRPDSHWPKTFVFRWLIALALHAGLLHALAGSGTISALFSPGEHVSLMTILIVCAFLVLRVYVMLLWPAALISLLAWSYGRYRREA